MAERRIISSNKVSPISMDNVEIRAVAKFGCSKNLTDIDPLAIAEVLRRHCIINEYDIEELREKQRSRLSTKNEVCTFLLNKMKSGCSFRDLIRILFSSGYTKIAEDMSFQLTFCLREDYISRVHNPDLSDRARISDRFRTIKSQVHALIFMNGYRDVRSLCDNKKRKIRKEPDKTGKMKLYDELVALKAAEMDAVTNIEGIVSNEHPGYIEIHDMINETLNPALTRVIFHGRIADVLSTVSNFKAAEDHIREAYTSANAIGSCIEVTDMMYKHVVVMLSEFESNPCAKVLNSILHTANIAMWSLQGQKEENRIFYSKLLLLRMAFAHLGIGKFCEMVKGYRPEMASLVQAEKLLANRDLEDLEHRRQMFFETAKARLFQWKGHMEKALHHLGEARRLAIEGHYAENKGLEEFERQLKDNPWAMSTQQGDETDDYSFGWFNTLNFSLSDAEASSGEFETEVIFLRRPNE